MVRDVLIKVASYKKMRVRFEGSLAIYTRRVFCTRHTFLRFPEGNPTGLLEVHHIVSYAVSTCWLHIPTELCSQHVLAA